MRYLAIILFLLFFAFGCRDGGDSPGFYFPADEEEPVTTCDFSIWAEYTGDDFIDGEDWIYYAIFEDYDLTMLRSAGGNSTRILDGVTGSMPIECWIVIFVNKEFDPQGHDEFYWGPETGDPYHPDIIHHQGIGGDSYDYDFGTFDDKFLWPEFGNG